VDAVGLGGQPKVDGEAERAYVGEPLDFDAFYRHEYRRVFALAFAVLRSPAAAEDATQDAFLAVYKRWKAGPEVRNPGSYVRTAVMNRCRSAFRRRFVETKALILLGRRAEGVELPESSRQFIDAIRALPARQSQVAALFYLDDRPIEEIAGILGMADGTVKSHLHRARQTLAKALDVADVDTEEAE
jgi:RNA polymerase sigma-70 factor (ECF subfamily)